MKIFLKLFLLTTFVAISFTGCKERPKNKTAFAEQKRTEANQSRLNRVQPAPKVDFSIERQNLINRFLMMNDETIVFYLYIFNAGTPSPILELTINKVSSVNSQLTNPTQIVDGTPHYTGYHPHSLPSPAEDGSYGTNGDAVFGFTPDDIYVETNMRYVVLSVPVQQWKSPSIKVEISNLEDYKKLIDKVLSRN